MAIERLTAEDALMLWPDQVWPQDVGALALLDEVPLVDSKGRFRIEVAREHVGGRLHLAPRFRQLLYVPPARLGGPLWIDAPAFDIRDHVRAVDVAAPGGEAELLLAVERLRRRRLDRTRPLWEMWFLTGLKGGRLGLFVRFHHALGDGMAGVATMAAFLDADPQIPPPQPNAWTPTPPPTVRELLDDSRAQTALVRRQTLAALRQPTTTAKKGFGALHALRELVIAPPLAPTSLDRVVGPDRALAIARSRLDRVKGVAHMHQATVNDVLLSAIGGALRTLFASRGEIVPGAVLRVYVPISLHSRAEGPPEGNLITQMVVPISVGTSDRSSRLRQIAVETARRKAKPHPALSKMPQRGIAARVFLKLLDRQHVNVTTANLPGPQMRLYFGGAPVLEVFPLTQLLGRVSLGVAAISYAGQFNLMVVADKDAYPDLDVFAAALQKEIAALEALSRAA